MNLLFKCISSDFSGHERVNQDVLCMLSCLIRSLALQFLRTNFKRCESVLRNEEYDLDGDLEELAKDLQIDYQKSPNVQANPTSVVESNKDAVMPDNDEKAIPPKGPNVTNLENDDSKADAQLPGKMQTEVDEFSVKTASQKKAEKKEKEKQKKLQLKLQSKGKEKTEATVQSTNKIDAKAPSTKPDNEPDELLSKKSAVDSPKSKKGSGKDEKKPSEKSKSDKRKPNKAQIAAMKEMLFRVNEEENKLRAEEEERIRKLEEAENERLLAIQRENERKERKKLKDKERKQRLKMEGKLLTKAQKFDQFKARQMLESMKASGQIDLSASSNQKMKKRRPPKKKALLETENFFGDNFNVSLTTSLTLSDNDIEDEEDIEDDVKSDWEISSTSSSSSEDDQNEEKASIDFDDKNNNISDHENELELKPQNDLAIPVNKMEVSRNKMKEKFYLKIKEAESKLSLENLRAPIVCVLGHVDTGKTKILDKLRSSNVQQGEAGGITQQIGATNVPKTAIETQTSFVLKTPDECIKVPGMLIIDTPGHESFSNLRSRGSSLCDMAVLVVDIMHGLEPQTIESLKLLKKPVFYKPIYSTPLFLLSDKKGKVPFVIALNKVDRLYGWTPHEQFDITETLDKQSVHTLNDFEKRVNEIVVQFALEHVNISLFNKNPRKDFIPMVPTSAISGDGMGNLMHFLTQMAQGELLPTFQYSSEILKCTVLEVKEIAGLGTTIDVILANGIIRETDTIIVGGIDGPIVTSVRALLMPEPMKELRVKNQYEKHKEVCAAQGIKICAKDLEKAMPGLPLFVAEKADEIEFYKSELTNFIDEMLKGIKLSDQGVYVQASTLGSLEALLEFLKTSKVPYSGISLGPVHKKDVVKASAMLEHTPRYAIILAFDVKVDKDAQELADSLKLSIFCAEIIYHLFDKFNQYQKEYMDAKKDENRHLVVFPCKLNIIPSFVFNSRNPIICGVNILEGDLHIGTPLSIPSKEFLNLGIVSSIEHNHKPIEIAKKGQEVCIKIDPLQSEAPKMYGRHFDHTDTIVSKISRVSIDVMKEFFKDEVHKNDWKLIIELKKMLQIL